MKDNSDILLFKEVQSGNEVAFEHLFRKYYYQLCVYAREYVKKNEIAEEVVEDVFCKVWEKKSEIEINTSLKSYLYRSVSNSSINYIKSKQNNSRHNSEFIEIYENRIEISTSLDFTSDNLLTEELQEKIKIGIELLPEQCKVIFKMSRFENLKYIEIAEKLNISIKTVETQISRALTKMRLHLKDYLLILLLLGIHSLF